MIVGELDAVYIIYFIFKKNTKPVVMTLQTPRATIQPVHIVRSNLPVNLLVYTTPTCAPLVLTVTSQMVMESYLPYVRSIY